MKIRIPLINIFAVILSIAVLTTNSWAVTAFAIAAMAAFLVNEKVPSLSITPSIERMAAMEQRLAAIEMDEQRLATIEQEQAAQRVMIGMKQR